MLGAISPQLPIPFLFFSFFQAKNADKRDMIRVACSLSNFVPRYNRVSSPPVADPSIYKALHTRLSNVEAVASN